MKKSIFAIGLLSLVMVLTSFTTPQATSKAVTTNTSVEAAGSSASGGNVRLD